MGLFRKIISHKSKDLEREKPPSNGMIAGTNSRAQQSSVPDAPATRPSDNTRGTSEKRVDKERTDVRAMNKDIPNNKNWDLKVLVEPTRKENIIDIVAVHGIGADPADTWVHKNFKTNADGKKIEVSRVDWLQDQSMLPSIVPNARIMRFGYPSSWFGSRDEQHTETFVSDVSEQLSRRLNQVRNGSTRPLIFIAHSYGGLPVIDALRDSILKQNSGGKPPNPVSSAFQFTAGLLFFGVPFQGRGGPSTEEWIKKIKEHHKNDPDFQVWNQTMTASVPKSQFLQGLVGQYLETRVCDHPIPITCFWERFASRVGKFWGEEDPEKSNFIVVSKTSACLQRSKDVSQVPLDRNHYNLNRFEGPEDPVWKMVVPEIQQRAGYASEFLSRRDQDLGFAVNWSLYHLIKTAHFVARESDLKKMEGLLQKQNGRRSVVVSGLGGMGKTQLAIQYAQLHKDEYSAVFFLDITSDTSMRKSYDVIAARIVADHPTTNRLEVTPEKDEQNSNAVVSAVKKWLELPKNTSWLMVFDNYDNPAVPTNTHPKRVDIQDYLPVCNHGSVIVTTRVEDVKLDPQSSMKIEKVSDLHGQEILAMTSGRQEVLKNKNAYRLATKLGGHPLALAIAGSYLHTSHMSFEKYLDFYEGQWKRLQSMGPKLDSYNYTLLTTWHITVDQLKKNHPGSIKMLKLLGYTRDGSMSYEWLKKGKPLMPKAVQRIIQDELEFSETMRHLINYGLVELVHGAVEPNQDDPMRFTMHSVVHAWCKHDLNEELDVELAWSVYTCAVYMADREDITKFRSLMASNDGAWSQLINVWRTNENIRRFLQQHKGFQFPSDWEALDFLLGVLAWYMFSVPGSIDDIEEVFSVPSAHFEGYSFDVTRSSFLPQELKDIVAKGFTPHHSRIFIHFPAIESPSPRRDKPRHAISEEEIQALAEKAIQGELLKVEHRHTGIWGLKLTILRGKVIDEHLRSYGASLDLFCELRHKWGVQVVEKHGFF